MTPFTNQCMHRPREGRGRKGQRPPKKTKQRGGGESPSTYEQETARTSHRGGPLHPTRTRLPTRGGRGRQGRPPQKRKTTQPLLQTPGQARPRATPTGPTSRTPRDHPVQHSNRPQPEKADHNSHGATYGPEERPARTRRHMTPPEKRQTTYHGAADTARTAGRETEPHTDQKNKKKGGAAT